MKINPNYIYALYNKGVNLGNLGKYKEAIESFDKALKIDPNDVNALTSKGDALNRLRREAIESFDKTR